jgi:hypothetical protein
VHPKVVVSALAFAMASARALHGQPWRRWIREMVTIRSQGDHFDEPTVNVGWPPRHLQWTGIETPMTAPRTFGRRSSNLHEGIPGLGAWGCEPSRSGDGPLQESNT